MKWFIRLFSDDISSLLFPRPYNSKTYGVDIKTLPEDAYEAWRMDMENIGMDMRKVMDRVRKERHA